MGLARRTVMNDSRDCRADFRSTVSEVAPGNILRIKTPRPEAALSVTASNPEEIANGSPDPQRRRIPALARRPDLETKPRSGSCSGSLDRKRYAENLATTRLAGSGCLSPKDIIFRVPPLPTQPPRSSARVQTIQKARSTLDLSSEPDSSLDRAIPVEILHVMKRLSAVGRVQDDDDVGQESESEDSYVIWSDDDVSVTSSASGTPTSGQPNRLLAEYQPVNKAHRVALELTSTEEAYVNKLEILEKARSMTEQILGRDIARQMFPYINSMFTLHKENFLPHLKDRLSNWTSCPNIGDIMKTFAPYLKIYTDYVKNFHQALSVLETWNSKNTSFSQMLRSLTAKSGAQKRQEEAFDLRLEIKAHMLEPVQRLPRYQLLLKQYCKEIDANTKEYEDVQTALSSITEAAMHFEDMMKHDTQMGELSDIQRQIDCPFNLISSNRYLIKHGKIGKVHATTGKVAERYIFLFNDLFLLCSENQWMPFSVYRYKVRHLAEIDAIQVVDGDNTDVPHTFYIKSTKKAIELCARNEEEKTEWVQAIWQVVGERMRNKLSKANQTSIRRTMLLCSEGTLGKEAPSWIHNSQVTMCMLCAVSFKGLKRKHHCRSCGMVVCSKCSSHTAPLEYEDFKEMRVCDECYLLLGENNHVIKQHSTYQKHRGTSVCKGYVMMSSDLARSWHRRWIEIHSDHRLCCYKAQQDVRAVIELQISCCTIEVCVTTNSPAKLIRIQTKDRIYLLRPEGEDDLQRWIDAMRTFSVLTPTSSVC